MIRSAMSLNAAVWPETYATASPPAVAFGTTSLRRRSTSVSVASSWGAEVGLTKTIATVFASLNCGLSTDATPWMPATSCRSRCGACCVPATSTTIGIGPLKPGPKPSASRSYARRLVCSVGCVPWSAAPSRTRSDVDASARMATSPIGKTYLRVGCDEPAPAGDERLLPALLGIVGRPDERHLQPVDLVPELGENGQKQRVGNQHRRENTESAADPELGDEVEAEEREPAHRDGDRRAGEQHRTAGRRASFSRRLVRRDPVVQELSEARDDEERVVDSDARGRSSRRGAV